MILVKNNKFYDLRIDNLELMCPNCFVQRFTLQQFITKMDRVVQKCIGCGYRLIDTNKKTYNNKNIVCFVIKKFRTGRN